MITAFHLIFVASFASILNSKAPPKYGPYTCKAPTEITIKGLQTGGSDKAYLMYPEEASTTKHFPFLVFGHGDTAGGTETYSGYSTLWKSVCSYGYQSIINTQPSAIPPIRTLQQTKYIQTTFYT